MPGNRDAHPPPGPSSSTCYCCYQSRPVTDPSQGKPYTRCAAAAAEAGAGAGGGGLLASLATRIFCIILAFRISPFFCEEFLRISISSISLNFSHLILIPMALFMDIMLYFTREIHFVVVSLKK